MSSSIHIAIMSSELSFEKQVDSTHKALKNFNAVKSFKSSVIVRAAMINLIDITIAFNQYTPFFLKEVAFQELLTADVIALHLPMEIKKIAQGYLSYSTSKPLRTTASIFM